MTNIALITGASAGIGKEFARYHASKGGDMILVARRENALSELKAELEAKHSVEVHVLAMDLVNENAPAAIHQFAKDKDLTVDILINNAGFGGHGAHIERELEDEMAMIDLNVKSLVKLTHLFANDMAANGNGKILNVGSTAGFAPGPLQAVYFATKAFVNSFSQAIDQELRSKGVTCTVLAPGYVHTEFAEVADLQGTGLVKQKGASAISVAKHGYDAMMAGKLVTVNEKMLGFLMQWIIPLMPRRLVLKQIEAMQKK